MPADVEEYLADLQHPLKDGVLRLRAVILAADPGISEHIKWNAPSFRYDGEDRVTFRLQPRGRLQLIFHRGAKVRADSAGFTFDDPSGLMTWPAPDRAVVDFPGLEFVAEHEAEVKELVRRWVTS
ncbi:DUF1801 domain-containing protein [Actinoplanes bogorensis]|uniref:DUF1801 domain-containing protein n=1 Tax=Paractinoplanes bogorensis TaxID=1610840 RepID=A0ABS5YQ43_9ACTN|nr:DUF1801 domain-containing protein [Actinoplanes bogorensis]MBU2665578.1 DUF1801 domain-containing protein [Actinoplanes bogorensis]